MTEALFGWPPPVLDPAGPYASSVTILAWALFAIGAAVTAMVVAALYVAIKGRPALKAKLGGERAIWIAGIGLPVVVLTVLVGLGTVADGAAQPADRRTRNAHPRVGRIVLVSRRLPRCARAGRAARRQ